MIYYDGSMIIPVSAQIEKVLALTASLATFRCCAAVTEASVHILLYHPELGSQTLCTWPSPLSTQEINSEETETSASGMTSYEHLVISFLFRILALRITSCVVLGKILDLSVLQFPHLEAKDNLT